jgi:hypothetical protein
MTTTILKILITLKPKLLVLLLLLIWNADLLFGQKVKYAELTYLSVDTTFIPYSRFDTILLNDEIFAHPRDTLLAHLSIDSLTYIVAPDHMISRRTEVVLRKLHPAPKFELWRFFDFKNDQSYNFAISNKKEIEIKGSWKLYQNWRGQDFSYTDITYVNNSESFLGYSVKEAYYKGTKNKRAVIVQGKFTPDILFKLCIAPPHHQKTYYCPLDVHVEYFLDYHSVKHIQLLEVKELSKKEFKNRMRKYLGAEYLQVFRK